VLYLYIYYASSADRKQSLQIRQTLHKYVALYYHIMTLLYIVVLYAAGTVVVRSLFE